MMKIKTLILLSTYNGELYLAEFLQSLIQQTENAWHLLVRDDGSNDATVSILQKILKQYPDKITLYKGKNLGVKESFNDLIKPILSGYYNVKTYVMFADQDDVWMADKLEVSLKAMNHNGKAHRLPRLVYTDLEVTDAYLKPIHSSLWQYENNTIHCTRLNALLYKNRVTGCTMMVNQALLKLACPIPKAAMMHDWWLNMVASRFGQVVEVDRATIYYRQHINNTIGAQKPKLTVLENILNLILRKNEPYLDHLEPHRQQAQAFLSCYQSQLKAKEIKSIEAYIELPKFNGLKKRRLIIQYQLFRPGILENLVLLLRV